VAATADPRHRDYFKPDFFNGIGQQQASVVASAYGC
jgi:hypothetical protein